jgi:hypothetical protein
MSEPVIFPPFAFPSYKGEANKKETTGFEAKRRGSPA